MIHSDDAVSKLNEPTGEREMGVKRSRCAVALRAFSSKEAGRIWDYAFVFLIAIASQRWPAFHFFFLQVPHLPFPSSCDWGDKINGAQTKIKTMALCVWWPILWRLLLILVLHVIFKTDFIIVMHMGDFGSVRSAMVVVVEIARFSYDEFGAGGRSPYEWKFRPLRPTLFSS